MAVDLGARERNRGCSHWTGGHPGDEFLHFYLAETWTRLGKSESPARPCERALGSAGPDHANCTTARQNLASVLLQQPGL